MNFNSMIIKNRFWQECQRFDRAQNNHEMIDTKQTPQVEDTTETL